MFKKHLDIKPSKAHNLVLPKPFLLHLISYHYEKHTSGDLLLLDQNQITNIVVQQHNNMAGEA